MAKPHTLLLRGTTWRNWGRSERTTPAFRARPGTVDELVAVLAQARERSLPVKVVGASHSFTAIAATDGILIEIDAISGIIAADARTGRVTLGAGTHLYDLPELLAPYGLALTNMGDIDRQTIAGATSTGTHGTGLAFGGLATQVVGVVLVLADGTLLRVNETENAELLPAVRLGLGALGILVEMTIQCVPAFLLHAEERPQRFGEVLDEFEALAGSVDHFEFYWWPHTDAAMTKRNTRLPIDAPRYPIGPVSGWVEDRLLGNGAHALMCNIGRVIPSATPPINRLATRLYGNRSFTDLSYKVFTSPRTTRFRESEWALPIAAVPQALRDIRGLIEKRGWNISFPIEVRVAAADDNWMSTAYDRVSGYIAVHRYFHEDHEPYFRAVDQIMRGYGGRPHWGKIHYLDDEDVAERYPKFDQFRAVRDRLDPERVFANPYLKRVLGR